MAALSLFGRREDPGVTLGAAKRLIADSLTNPAQVDELTERLQWFRLAGALERLRRAGLYEVVLHGNPFDPEAEGAVKLTREDYEFFNSQPSKEEIRAHLQRRLGMH